MPHPRRAVPAAILTAGVLTATAILLNAAADAVPPTATSSRPAIGTPDDPTNPLPWTPDGR